MSRYQKFKADKLNDCSLYSRHSKVQVADFSKVMETNSFASFIDSLPSILAGNELRNLVEKIVAARNSKRALIWGFGGHVIKVGLAPILIELIRRGFVTALATNGSGMIHDFEIALSGATSEDVEQELAGGAFGMARETGEYLNRTINEGVDHGKGIGEAVGEFLENAETKYPDLSLLLQAYRYEVPLTVHIAIGTDIIHNHPLASGAALGKGSQIDFQIFCRQVIDLDQGGVFLNLGSAVLLPEIFLKAVSLVRNTGRSLKNFSTANLDFIQHYRPTQNVVRRPVTGSGKGFALTGHHEIMVPLLAAMLLLKDNGGPDAETRLPSTGAV